MAIGRSILKCGIFGYFLVFSSGCSLLNAGEVQAPVLDALTDHDPKSADSLLSDALGPPIGKLPDRQHNYTGWLLAQRGVVRLSSESYADSAADLGLADKMFDIQDMREDDFLRGITPRITRHANHMGWLGAINAAYTPRLHERLMINGLAMLDYLDLGDSENARVEARRLDVMSIFADRLSPQSSSRRTRAFTGILAGFAFEQEGDDSAACDAYRKAEAASEVDLSALVPGGKDPIACSDDAEEVSREELASNGNSSDVLVVVAYGLVPHAELPHEPPKTITLYTGQTVQLPQYAQLVGGNDSAEAPSIEVDGKLRIGVSVLNLAGVVQDDFAQATKEIGGNTTPLSWSSLPARFVVDRVSVSPGTHHVRLVVRGETKNVDVVTHAGGFAATSLVVLR
jgi:hypothetical protein